MTEYDYTSLIYELLRDADTQMEFWIQATFAVVVAVFFAGHRLSKGMRRMIAFLYVSASLLAAIRWNLTIWRSIQYRERMVGAGFADIETSGPTIFVVVILTIGIFLVGAGGTVWFLMRARSEPEAKSA